MTSISGTTRASLELHLIRRSAPAEQDPAADKRRQDRENGRVAAQEFANEALLTAVTVLRTCPDPKQKLTAAKMIMDRAWGAPKVDESENQKLANRNILDILSAISQENTKQLEKPVHAQQIEQKPSNPALEALFEEEIEDAEIVTGVQGESGPQFAQAEPVPATQSVAPAVPGSKPRRGRPPKGK